MVFIITELYMSIVMLVSLIILSLRKENYKSLMNMMLLFYIITLVIIYDGIINKNISIFIFNYNLKIDYLTIILKSIIVIFMLNYIYTFTLLLKKIKKIKKIKKKFIFKYKNETKLEKNNKRYYRNNLILDSPPKIDLVVLNGSKNKLIEINNTKTTRQCDLLHKYTNALDISILKKNNGFFKNLNIDKKFDYKNFHYYKQCNLIDIKECSANISENIIKDVELNQVLFDLQNNMQD